jgi:hypothetical protein
LSSLFLLYLLSNALNVLDSVFLGLFLPVTKMELHALRQPAASCCLAVQTGKLTLSPILARPVSLPIASRRSKATSARARRALRLPPHPSFLSPVSSNTVTLTGATTSNGEAVTTSSDTLIFNPPASAPSVFNTPYKFLPRTDPRRRANLPDLFRNSATIQYKSGRTATNTGRLPPPVSPRELREKQHHLTLQDVEEIRRLRAEDPIKYSVGALADKYKCTKLFIMMCVQASKEHQQRHKEAVEHIKSRWGPIRAAARAARQKRWEMLLRGEL